MTHRWRHETRTLGALAVPLVLAQLAQNGMSLVDTVIVGRLGPRALAGIALGGTLFVFVFILLMAVLLSVGPLVAQAHGARNREDAARAARQGLWLAAVLSVPGVAVLLNAERLLLWSGQDPATAAASGAYLAAMAFGLPCALAFTALRGFLEGQGHTRPILLLAGAGVALNVVANQALMFGRWGLPALGLVGTGYATSAVYLVMVLGAAGYVAWAYPRHRVFRGMRRPDPAMLGELFRVGWPISLTLGFETGLFSLTALLMGRFGDAALAGHQIALQSASTTFMVPLGIGIATGVRVGQAVGRDDPAGVARAAWVGLALSGAFMMCAALLFWTAPDAVIALYLRLGDPANAAVIPFARRFLAIAGLFQVFDGVQVAASGALRGLKDTRVPMVLTLVAYWLVGVPCAVALAFGLGVGPSGLWFGLVAGLGTAALLLLRRVAGSTRGAMSARATAADPLR